MEILLSPAHHDIDTPAQPCEIYLEFLDWDLFFSHGAYDAPHPQNVDAATVSWEELVCLQDSVVEGCDLLGLFRNSFHVFLLFGRYLDCVLGSAECRVLYILKNRCSKKHE